MAFYHELSKKYGDHIACIDAEGNCLTYQELEVICDKLGNCMIERTLVFLFCTNSIGSIVGYISFLRKGIVPVLLNSEMNEELRDDLLKLYEPEYIYLTIDKKQIFSGWDCLWEGSGYCLLQNPKHVSVVLYPQLGLLLTTSGSTGSPKFVRQSYENIQANAASIAAYLQLDQTERPITTLPMNYTYGLSIVNSHLFVGAALLLTEDALVSRKFWDFFNRENATSFGGVPFTYEMLKKLHFFKMELPSLRTMTQAGGKLAPQLHKEFAEYAMEHGKHFVVMYGQTEATARMGYLPWEMAVQKYGSMGIAIPGGKLWLKDGEGNKVTQPGIVGELIYEGANVTLGYAECPEDLQKGDERHGILETGDMAKQDEDGFFYIVGRKKRFLKIYGNRVNLDETERMIKEQYQEIDCACAGVDDKLYVFVTVDDEELFLEIRHFLMERTSLNPEAFIVKYISEIPKNDAGKALYHDLEVFYD